MIRRPTHRRSGVTLLEVMTALALSATMMTTSFVVLRSSYTAWTTHEADLESAANAVAVLRHLTRNVRQSVGVSAISAASDTSGALTVVMQDGSTLTWDHSGTAVTLAEDGGAAHPLADDVQQLVVEGYLADGATLSTDPSDVQAVRVAATVPMPAGGTRTVSSFAWVRSW